jgi:hypothetical protein
MTPTFSSDGAARLNWNFRVDENNVPISLTFVNSAGAAYSFVYDDFQVRFKKNKGDKKNVLVMGFGSGLTLAANVLTIDLNRVRAKLTAGEYYWQLYKNDYGRVWLDGVATGYDGLLPVIEESTTVTINDGGTDVTVTITEATPNVITTTAAAWGGITGTLSAQTDLNTELGLKAPLASPTFTGTPAAPTAAQGTSNTQVATTAYVIAEIAAKAPKVIQLACSDETTALTTGTGKITFRMPYAMTVTAVRASLTTAQTSGSVLTVDINDSGTTILSTKLTFDNTEKTTTTATTAAVISDTALADDAEISIDIDQIGDGTAKGLKVTIIGY